jgi:transaldolase
VLFLDSTDPDQVREIFSWGVVRGVTTNPLIFAREAGGADFEQRIRSVVAESQGPVSVELLAEDEPAMLAEASSYHAWSPDRICIKVPFSETGLRVASSLHREGMRTNITCVMSFNQAYLASLTGATYVSIFSGRVRDTGYDVRTTISETRAQLDREALTTQLMVGSIRHPMDVHDALTAGAHVVTVPPDILRKMLHHPKTDEAIREFRKAWDERSG